MCNTFIPVFSSCTMLDGLFAAVFQCAFIAAFPIIGMIVVTKWVVDDWKKNRD